MAKNVSIMIFSTLIVGCVSKIQSSSTMTPAIQAEAINISTPQVELLINEEANQSELSLQKIEDLSFGEYLLYTASRYDEIQNTVIEELFITEVEKEGDLRLRLNIDISGYALSVDMPYIFFLPHQDTQNHPFMIDFEVKKRSLLPENLRQCTSLSNIHDNLFAASCAFDDEHELYEIDITSQIFTKITNCASRNNECILPKLSPDKKWLSYYQRPQGGLQGISGLNVVPSSCISSDGCDDLNVEPYDFSAVYAWSPNNHYLAANQGDNIQIYNFTDGVLSKSSFVIQKNSYCSIAWSPDSTKLAFTGDEIFTFDIQSEAINKIPTIEKNSCVIGWINIQ